MGSGKGEGDSHPHMTPPSWGGIDREGGARERGGREANLNPPCFLIGARLVSIVFAAEWESWNPCKQAPICGHYGLG